jgi:hypothetical protein
VPPPMMPRSLPFNRTGITKGQQLQAPDQRHL